MYIYQDLLARADAGRPVRVGLIGAGKFGSMFLSQVPTTPALKVSIIADLDPDNARRTCANVGWSAAYIAQTEFTDDAFAMLASNDVDVVVEATGSPAAGIVHARAAFAAGKHIIMVNVEADALAGPLLALEAKDAGVVYSMAYGDQPALTCELVEWARNCGFEVVAAGKGTKYLPSYHASTPDTVWDFYGLTAAQAAAAGMNSQMFNSFLDGTKSALEMAAIANATGLATPPHGLQFPPCGKDDLAHILRPREVGGVLHQKGQVEVVATAKRPLNAGERLDGEGGHTVYGKLLPAATSIEQGALPIGLAHDVVLQRPVDAGQCIAWRDVQVDETRDAVRARRAMEAHFRGTTR